MLDTIKSVPGVCFAELQNAKDGDACIYTVECESGADVRKKLFFTLAQKNMAMII